MPVVLIVDDHPGVRSMIEAILRTTGYTVLGAGSGRDALEICSREGQQVDLVIADVMMPEMSGPEMVREMRLRGINVPIVYISAYTDGDVGGERFLRKPFTSESLIRAVRSSLEAARQPTTTDRPGNGDK